MPPIKRKLGKAAKLIRRDPAAFFAVLLAALIPAKVKLCLVYSARPAEISQPDETGEKQHTIFRKITDQELARLSATTCFREQAERFSRMGFNAAYGLYFKNELVHVAWLIDAESDRQRSVRNVKSRLGEAEIAHCLTAKQYRGRGFQPLAIRYVCRTAAIRGIKRVFMITTRFNRASQRGIEKAGFCRCGWIWHIVFPFGSRRLHLTLRGHRWVSFMGTVSNVLKQAIINTSGEDRSTNQDPSAAPDVNRSEDIT